jgi:hypothetical protein
VMEVFALASLMGKILLSSEGRGRRTEQEERAVERGQRIYGGETYLLQRHLYGCLHDAYKMSRSLKIGLIIL